MRGLLSRATIATGNAPHPGSPQQARICTVGSPWARRDRELAKFEAFLNKEECLNINALVRGSSRMAYHIKKCVRGGQHGGVQQRSSADGQMESGAGRGHLGGPRRRSGRSGHPLPAGQRSAVNESASAPGGAECSPAHSARFLRARSYWEGVYVVYTYAARRQTAKAVQKLLSTPDVGSEDNILRHITFCKY